MHFVTFLPLAQCTSVVHGVMYSVKSVTTVCYMSVISSYTVCLSTISYHTVHVWYMVSLAITLYMCGTLCKAFCELSYYILLHVCHQ